MTYCTEYVWICDQCGKEHKVSRDLAMAPLWFCVSQTDENEDGTSSLVDLCSRRCLKRWVKAS